MADLVQARPLTSQAKKLIFLYLIAKRKQKDNSNTLQSFLWSTLGAAEQQPQQRSASWSLGVDVYAHPVV